MKVRSVDIAVDGEDNIVVMGTFKGNMQLGDVSLVANTEYGSVFLAHYHRNGTLLWAKEVCVRLAVVPMRTHQTHISAPQPGAF